LHSAAASNARSAVRGLLIGKKDLVATRCSTIARTKTPSAAARKSQRKIVGMVKAVEMFLKDDHEALNKEWQRRLEYISSQITKIRR